MAFRQELLNNSDAAKEEIEKELGQKLPVGFQIKVLQETDNMAYLVLPVIPAVKDELSEEQLEAVAGGGDCSVVGVTISVDCKLGSVCVAKGSEDGGW
jgi:hypothetical protein